MEGVDPSLVLDWQQRSKRQRTKPVTYWEEFVETDKWYAEELVRDVPDDELDAAVCDSDYSNSESEPDDVSDAGSCAELSVADDASSTSGGHDSTASSESESADDYSGSASEGE